MLDIDALRDELTAAQTVLEPQIRGIQALLAAAPQSAFADELNEQLQLHNNRFDLISVVLKACNAVHDALGNLNADGYPNLNITPINQVDFEAMKSEVQDIEAAFDLFGHEASGVNISLNQPAEK